MLRIYNMFLTCVVYTFLVNSHAFANEEINEISDSKISANSLEQRLKHTIRTFDVHVAELTGFPIIAEDDKLPVITPRAERAVDSKIMALQNEIKNQVLPVLNDLKSYLALLEKKHGSVNTYNPSPYIFQEHYTAIRSFPIGVDSNRICEKNFSKSELSETEAKKPIPKSCKDIQKNGNNVTGIYEIQPRISEKPIIVLCDMDTRGGGWTHIHKRFDGSQDFYLDWREYKFGFGDLQGEFWLGLENIYKMTGFETNELLVELVDRDNIKAYAHFKAFGIGSEKEGYPLKVLKEYSGDAGDALIPHLGAKFTTKDLDQDTYSDNCAVLYTGAWWHKACHSSNLNGKYLNIDLPKAYQYKGLHWNGYRAHDYCLAKARMMVRPAE